MTTITNAFPANLPVGYQAAATVSFFPAGQDTGTFLSELFPFGMVYEMLERTFARYGVPADAAALLEKRRLSSYRQADVCVW